MQNKPCPAPVRPETAVKNRYAAAAKAPEAALCCPVEYNRDLLKIIPQEVIEKDYGCGGPSRYLKPGETVLDLGSGTGKICFIAAQVVGAKGRVIGVDMTDDMLEVARRNAPIVAERLGFANVEFRKGRIQDLALDLEKLDAELRQRPITNAAAFLAADELAEDETAADPSHLGMKSPGQEAPVARSAPPQLLPQPAVQARQCSPVRTAQPSSRSGVTSHR